MAIHPTLISASVIDIDDVVTTAVGTVGIGAIVAGGAPPAPIQPSTVPQGVPQAPQGVPQPGTGTNSMVLLSVLVKLSDSRLICNL